MSSDTTARKKPRRRPKPATPEALERAALSYLERYASSAENLRRVLLRRIARAASHGGEDPNAGEAAVEALITRLKRASLLDDKLYAETRGVSLNRRGVSRRGIAARLAAKGVGEDDIAQALHQLARDVAEPDLAAALTYARRRRLGPYRPAEERAERRTRDLASLARQGFEYSLALKVVDAGTPDEIEGELAETGGAVEN